MALGDFKRQEGMWVQIALAGRETWAQMASPSTLTKREEGISDFGEADISYDG